MKITEYTTEGPTERLLSVAEVEKLAAGGDIDAKKEIAEKALKSASTNSERLDVIEEFLGLK